MNFTVIWRPQALADLAAVWTAAPDRDAVTTASNRIDELLARNPLTAGEERDGDDRLVFERPLGVLYRVDAARRRVLVLGAGLYGHRV